MKRLTQDAFADMLDIKKGKLIAWENKSEPKFDELIRICDILTVNMLDFVTKEMTSQNLHEFSLGTIELPASTSKFNEPAMSYGNHQFNKNIENVDDLDIFSIIDRVTYTGDMSARRELAGTLKTELGKLLLDLSRQKDENLKLLKESKQDSARLAEQLRDLLNTENEFANDPAADADELTDEE